MVSDTSHAGWMAPFQALDEMRRAQGRALEALGFGAQEHPYRVVAAGARWRLRRYGAQAGPAVLIVPAPIKRPYIWDLTAEVSVVRRCLTQGLDVWLLEWTPPHEGGLADYADTAIAQALAALARARSGAVPVLMGHSLGGTLVAIFAARRPQRLRAAVLLGAPLCLAPGVSPFRDVLAAAPCEWLAVTPTVPGSFLSQMSGLAAAWTFVGARLWDAVATAGDERAAQLRPRLARWALDEVPLAGGLVHDLLRQLYAEDAFCRGTLGVAGRTLAPGCIRAPMLAVANRQDEVAPPASVAPFLAATATPDTRLIDYKGEPGVGLQHLGVLIGRHALDAIWPEIIAWIRARA